MADPKKKKGDDGGDTTVETPETSEAGATATDPRVAELEGQVESLRNELATERDLHQQDMAAMKRRFGGQQPESLQAGPVRGRTQRFAASLIRCHDKNGAKLTLGAGDPIPDEADLTGVSRDAIEER